MARRALWREITPVLALFADRFGADLKIAPDAEKPLARGFPESNRPYGRCFKSSPAGRQPPPPPAIEHFTLPKAERALLALRNARIVQAYTTHKTVRELAVEHHLHERQIERIVAAAGAKAPAERRQASLF